MEMSEALATIIGMLRCRLADEAFPPFATPEHDRFCEAIVLFSSHPTAHEFIELGAATAKLLNDNMRAGLLAEKSALVAQIAAKREGAS